MVHFGLYEQLINHTLRQELESIPAERKSVAPVDPAEAAEVLSRYIAEAAKRALSGLAEGRGDVADQVALAKPADRSAAGDGGPGHRREG